ncbi:c4d7b7e9-803e-4d51-ae8f-91bde273656d [Sclerotinia trifoliorum]|uniref:C4d7b7e9-803e-4d51-ae8f-91bde273656d n=1 Tax=Sclerotinia trifoliorum TaxID=28548 RepID=A0A8H2ZNN9_9HELO|nr:c4d7b7e9-803e-4d51-ae8f-91bde273656d [Sclerotinia trifoliorum]
MLHKTFYLSLLCSFSAFANAGALNAAIGPPVSSVRNSTTPDVNICCKALKQALGSKVSYSNSSTYTAFLENFYSQQESDISPGCILSPTSTIDVSIAVAILSVLGKSTNWKPSCQFAIKSGGHAPGAGEANINQGVSIDLSSINAISVNTNESVVSVGPAAKWREVYSRLDALQLTVSGGRVSTVGVGGLTLGGGISYFSPKKGFTCDNVKNFEVVLANGRVVNANAKENSDLFLALKGGSNNLGVVTRIDFYAFKQGNIWGGNILYPITTADQQINALADFSSNATYDENASLIMSFAFQLGVGAVVVNNVVYTEPVVNPPVYQPFTSIQPQYLNTMGIRNLTDVTSETLATASRSRTLFKTTTFSANKEMIITAFNAYNASLPSIESLSGITWSLSLAPLPTNIPAKSAPLGGNVLGVTPEDGPLIVVLLTATWADISDDTLVTDTAQAIFDKIDSFATTKGYLNDWQYLNYAANSQDPIDGYGATNKAILQAASRKYDPAGVFQKGVPGGFKLFV